MDKITVDASERANIVFSDGAAKISVPTVQEAVICWRGLEKRRKARATIVTESGLRFGPDEIERLHYQ